MRCLTGLVDMEDLPGLTLLVNPEDVLLMLAILIGPKALFKREVVRHLGLPVRGPTGRPLL